MEASENEAREDAPSKIGERLRDLHSGSRPATRIRTRARSRRSTPSSSPAPRSTSATTSTRSSTTCGPRCASWTGTATRRRICSTAAASTRARARTDITRCPALPCPDGTWSSVGAKSIYDCIKFNAQVLSRFQPLVPYCWQQDHHLGLIIYSHADVQSRGVSVLRAYSGLGDKNNTVKGLWPCMGPFDAFDSAVVGHGRSVHSAQTTKVARGR
jgi:hypothetical protein